MTKQNDILTTGVKNHKLLTNIYMLVDPRNPEVARYIGKADCMQIRLRRHIRDSINQCDDNSPKENWIRSLVAIGLEPQMVLVAIVKKSEWEKFETHYISLFKSFGAKLFNIDTGGMGGAMPPSVRLKMGSKGKTNPNYGGKTVTEYQRQVARQTIQEHCLKSEGFKQYVETKMKGHKYWFGKNHTDETKKKIGDANRGNKHTEDFKQLMSKLHSSTVWITNGKVSKKILKGEQPPTGFRFGKTYTKKLK